MGYDPIGMGHVANPVERQLGLVLADEPVGAGDPFQRSAAEVDNPRPPSHRPADSSGQFKMAPALLAAIVRLVNPVRDLFIAGQQGQQESGQIVNVDQ